MTRRVRVGPVASIRSDACTAVGDGVAVVVRVGDEVCAYRNRCLHQDSPLAGGTVHDGVLVCPQHFWRYDAATGRVTAGSARLDRFPVEIVDGDVIVELPDEPPRRSLREELLERARSYDRASEFDRDATSRATTPPTD